MNNNNFTRTMRDCKSVQLDDEDSSKYFINYVSDDFEDNYYDENEHVHSSDNNDDTDVSSLPNSVIVTSLPQELFIDQQLKTEFEDLFRIYDSQIVVLYLKFFQRVRITFKSSYNALQARLHLHEYEFHGTIFKTYFASPIVLRGANSDTHLRPPEPEKLFLISPPSSPPVGWEQKFEDPPVVDLDLFAAIAQLQPNKPHELLPNELSSKAPSIVIHTCDDDEGNSEKAMKPKLVHTRRPPQKES